MSKMCDDCNCDKSIDDLLDEISTKSMEVERLHYENKHTEANKVLEEIAITKIMILKKIGMNLNLVKILRNSTGFDKQAIVMCGLKGCIESRIEQEEERTSMIEDKYKKGKIVKWELEIVKWELEKAKQQSSIWQLVFDIYNQNAEGYNALF